MVFVGDKKYACETCIKGHRSSTCKHTDRPLFEIKKKGRPVTQCEHCRELRKTRQVHVKCVCEHKDDHGEGPSRGVKNVPVSAAFPAGLPREAMEASVAAYLHSEGSDSERGSVGLSASECSCKSIGSCNCCTPRVPAHQRRRLSKGQAHPPPTIAEGDTTQHDDNLPAPVSRPAGLVALANTGGHRPVLPRPSSQRPPSPASTSSPAPHRASPSSHSSRHHSNNLFSPYGRAYEYAHGVEATGTVYHTPPTDSINEPSSTTVPTGMFDRSDVAAWNGLGPSFFENSMGSSLPNLCNCGPNCSCPACVIHRGPTFDPSAPFDTCNNPGACFACANCGLFNPNLPSSPAAMTNEQMGQFEFPENIDEWLRQLSSMLDNVPPPAQSSQEQQLGQQQTYPQQPSSSAPADAQQNIPFNPALWQSYALWSNLQNQASQASPAPEECCGGRCKCPAGMCVCAADCCGCCQGCQCSECTHEGDRTVTFAVSGERQSCSGPSNHGHHHGHGRRSPPSGGAGGSGSGSGSTSYGQGGQSSHFASGSSSSQSQSSYFGQWGDPSLTTHRATVSRASSTSSRHSGSGSSHSPSSSEYEYEYSVADQQVMSTCCSDLQNISTSSGSPQPPAHIPTSSSTSTSSVSASASASSVPAAYDYDRASPTFSDPSTQFRTLSSQHAGYDMFYSS